MTSTLRRKPVIQVGLVTLLLHLAACFSVEEARAQGNVVRLAGAAIAIAGNVDQRSRRAVDRPDVAFSHVEIY